MTLFTVKQKYNITYLSFGMIRCHGRHPELCEIFYDIALRIILLQFVFDLFSFRKNIKFK